MLPHPILINPPIVVTPWGVRLCRSSEAVLDVLPLPRMGALTREDGERLTDGVGHGWCLAARVAPRGAGAQSTPMYVWENGKW